MKLNANDIPIFAAIVENQGITSAANNLGIPKSTVSNALKRLEAVLGVRLLERNSRNIRLTSEGQSFYKRSVVITEQIDQAEAEMSGLQAEPKGALSISLTMAFSREIIRGHLAEFTRRYPLIELDVHVSNDYKIDVISDPVDVAIKVGELPDSELIVTKILQTPLVWASSPGYLKAIDNVNEETLVKHVRVIDKRYTKLPLLMHKGNQKKSITLGKVNVSNDPLMVRDMIVAGEGISLLPFVFCKEQLSSGQLVQLFSDWKIEPESVISAVYPSRRLVSAKTVLFVDYLKEVIRKNYT